MAFVRALTAVFPKEPPRLLAWTLAARPSSAQPATARTATASAASTFAGPQRAVATTRVAPSQHSSASVGTFFGCSRHFVCPSIPPCGFASGRRFSTSAPALETINAIMRKGRYCYRRSLFMKFKRHKTNRALEGCPQKKGVVLKLVTQRPKKPNSAVRKVAIVRLSNGKEVRAYIPGIGHSLQEHNVVLVRGHGPNDLVGVNYRLCRGAYDFAGVVGVRKNFGKWGAKKPDDKKRKRPNCWRPWWLPRTKG